MPVASRDIGDGIWVVHATGRLDAHAVPDLEAAFAALPAEGVAGVVVDLSDATYISSSGLKLIVAAWRRLRGQGRQLVLAGLGPRLREIFEMVGFTQILLLFDDVAAAQEHLRAAAQQPGAG